MMITVYGTAGEVVAKETALFDELGVRATAQFVPRKDYVGYEVVADLLEGTKLVDRVSKVVVPSEAEVTTFLENETANVVLIASLFFGILLIVVGSVYVFMRKRNVSPCALLLVMCMLFGATAVFADEFIAAYGERALYIPTNFQINSPRSAVVETYAVGEVVPFQIDLWSQNTNASWQNAEVRISEMYTQQNNTDKNWTAWQTMGTTRTLDYSQNNIPWTETLTVQAPDIPGTYRVDFQIKNDVQWTLGKTHQNFYEGYFEVVVVAPEPLAPLPDGIIVEAEVEVEAESE
jgi:hypothetical protein